MWSVTAAMLGVNGISALFGSLCAFPRERVKKKRKDTTREDQRKQRRNVGSWNYSQESAENKTLPPFPIPETLHFPYLLQALLTLYHNINSFE